MHAVRELKILQGFCRKNKKTRGLVSGPGKIFCSCTKINHSLMNLLLSGKQVLHLFEIQKSSEENLWLTP
jgi:hypothetical protein